MATIEQIAKALAGSALSSRSSDVVALVRPAIHVISNHVSVATLELGASRVGGVPDLPVGAGWPLWNGEPQSFVAQINLNDIRGLPAAQELPDGGHLTFFYSARQDTWGFDPKDGASWQVTYTPRDTPLSRTEPPAPVADGGSFQACSITFRAATTIPPWESKPAERLRLTEAESDAYFDLLELIHGGENHQLLGHPDQVQGDMTAECQLVTHGLFAGDSSGWNDPRAGALKAQSEQWRLLFQVASDDEAQMMWGDSGYLYFWIRDSDLASGTFDRGWMILQCY